VNYSSTNASTQDSQSLKEELIVQSVRSRVPPSYSAFQDGDGDGEPAGASIAGDSAGDGLVSPVPHHQFLCRTLLRGKQAKYHSQTHDFRFHNSSFTNSGNNVDLLVDYNIAFVDFSKEPQVKFWVTHLRRLFNLQRSDLL